MLLEEVESVEDAGGAGETGACVAVSPHCSAWNIADGVEKLEPGAVAVAVGDATFDC